MRAVSGFCLDVYVGLQVLHVDIHAWCITIAQNSCQLKNLVVLHMTASLGGFIQ